MCASGIRDQRDLQIVQTLLHASHLYAPDPNTQARLVMDSTANNKYFAGSAVIMQQELQPAAPC